MTRAGGDENSYQGDFGETWLELVAAAGRILHSRSTTLDLDKADVELTLQGEHWGTYSPTVKVQVKTVTNLHRLIGGDVSYDLDRKTYEVLRRDDHATRRVLVVAQVREDGVRTRVDADATTVYIQGYWMSLEGMTYSSNKNSQAVHIPAANRVDEEGLMRMLRICGVRRSTIVPDFEPWEQA